MGLPDARRDAGLGVDQIWGKREDGGQDDQVAVAIREVTTSGRRAGLGEGGKLSFGQAELEVLLKQPRQCVEWTLAVLPGGRSSSLGGARLGEVAMGLEGQRPLGWASSLDGV